MSVIEQALLSAFKKYSPQSLIIAYSGGVDSQVLLHCITHLIKTNNLTVPVSACHINHGLSDNARTWQEFAEQQCKQLSISLITKSVQLNKKNRQSLEEVARDARYREFDKLAAQHSMVITGHHQDDQVETFLLALKRGSGLKGLSAMTKLSQFGERQSSLLRPLLEVSRAEIVEYANEHNLRWIEDESNQDTQYDRNFLRQDIIPLLNQRWSSINQTISRSARHCRDGQQLLDEISKQDLSDCVLGDGYLSVKKLNAFSEHRFNCLVRYFLAENSCLMPSTQQLSELHQQLNASQDKSPQVKVGDKWLRRYRGGLYLTEEYQDITAWQVDILLEGDAQTITLPDNLGVLTVSQEELPTSDNSITIVPPAAQETISVRFHHNNPRCLPDFRQKSRSLKKVLQELNIAPWQRKRVPLLYYGDNFVAAIGYFVCQEYMVKDCELALKVCLVNQ